MSIEQLASHNILKKRNVALAAAYATVDKTFKEYRNRVVERFGAEVDKELRYNIKAKKFEETVTDPDSGTAIVEGRGKATSIENVTTVIAAVTEAYPELKSNENYKELMNELSITENLIAEYRENYNKQIKEYNRYVRKFPTRLFLNILGYEMQQYQYLDYDAPVDAPQNLFGD